MVFIWANGRIINFMVRANFILRMGPIIKGRLKMGLRPVRAGIFIIMAVYIRVGFLKIRRRGRVRTMILFRAIATKANGFKTCHQD